MHRKDLNERSPYRIFESSIHGGLGRGNLGVVVGRHGVGKTAFLVGVALDDLLRGKNVLHVALGQPMWKVREYYDEIFDDLARTAELENAPAVYREMERHRNIHAYLGKTFSVQKLADDLKILQEHADFKPSAILVDGVHFETTGPDQIAAYRKLARDNDAELWMTAVAHRESVFNQHGVPEPVAHLEASLDVIVRLYHDGRAVHVHLLKDHDNPQVSATRVALDPVTMLLIRE
jgi:hypothetical protein